MVGQEWPTYWNNKTMTQQNRAYMYAGATVLLWSTVATGFKIALRELDHIQVLFIASIVSMLSLLVVLFLQGNGAKIRTITASEFKRSALVGFLNPFFYYFILFKAFDLLPAQEAQPLNWTWPITLSLMSALLLKQKLTVQTMIAVVLCFLGVLIISTQGNITALQFTNLTGDILAVGSSIIWALYWILNLKDEREPVVKLFWNFVFGSIYITIAVIFLSEFPTSLSLSFGAAVYTGLFEMGLAFVLWLNALRLSRDSASVGIFAYMTPFLSLIFISIVLGEKILPSSVVGLIFIIGGIVVQAFMGGRKVA